VKRDGYSKLTASLASSLVGRVIERIEVERFEPREVDKTKEWAIHRIHFKGGGFLGLIADESDTEPFVKGIYVPRERKLRVR
jgi:hypothetical protein